MNKVKFLSVLMQYMSAIHSINISNCLFFVLAFGCFSKFPLFLSAWKKDSWTDFLADEDRPPPFHLLRGFFISKNSWCRVSGISAVGPLEVVLRVVDPQLSTWAVTWAKALKQVWVSDPQDIILVRYKMHSNETDRRLKILF